MKTLYTNGTILTMNPAHPTADSLVAENGRVLTLGRPADAANFRVVDLKGRTMLPAFLDAHGHFSGYANAQLQVPLEEAACFDDVAASLKAYIDTHDIPADQWIIGKGYDHNSLAERAHPTAAVLDQAAPEHPVIIIHQSNHMGVVNTEAMRRLGITADTPSPSGGLIAKENGAPTGYLEENAFVQYQARIPMPSMTDLMAAYSAVQDRYAAQGITTVQEGMTPAQLWPMYQHLMADDLLRLDVVAYAGMDAAEELFSLAPQCRRQYDHHFKLGGVKIFLDGSPQGHTAWMRQPYEGTDDRGYGTMTDGQVEAALRYALRENLQLLAHCNGDAAAEQFLRVCGLLAREGADVARIRPVMIHAQLAGPDQLPDLARLGVIPSFFVAHVYHWGDVHLRSFGRARASRISPAASAEAARLPFTFHTDTPVIEPNMLETIWCAAARRTKSGDSLAAEAVSVESALRAVTINAAHQYFEEREKGSLAPGKRADFVILDQNPLTAAVDDLRHIRVLETVKDGRTIYQR